MGRRGPRPLPTAVKLARGTYQPYRNSPAELHAAPGIPEMPVGFDAAERKEWHASAARLARMGVLNAENVDALTLLVKSKVRYLRLATKVHEMGEVIEDPSGNLVRNPYAIAMEKAVAEYRRMCEAFGITPSAATRVLCDRPGNQDTQSKRQRFFPHLRPVGGAG